MARLGVTPSQTIGPFFGFALPYADGPHMAEPGAAGAIRIVGTVYDGAGETVPDALIELWQADAGGRYGEGWTGFGRCPTSEAGAFEFVTVKPGPVEGQAPHIDVSVFARGLLVRVVTRIYFPDERAANAADAVLNAVEDPAARGTLIAVDEGDGTLRFDIRLQGDGETAFFAV